MDSHELMYDYNQKKSIRVLVQREPTKITWTSKDWITSIYPVLDWNCISSRVNPDYTDGHQGKWGGLVDSQEVS